MGKLEKKFKEQRWITSVQLDPFKNPDVSFMKDFLKELVSLGLEIVDINSSARGIKQDSLQMAAGIETMGLSTIPHVTPRDGLTNAILSQILGAYSWGNIRNFLIIRGDPREEVEGRGVYQTDSPELIERLNELRKERELDLLIGCAFSQTYTALDERQREIERLHKKIKGGVDFVMTQPIFYYPEWKSELQYISESVSLPFLVGLWPLFDEGTLEKIREGKITGVFIPEYTYKELKTNFAEAIPLQAGWFSEMIQHMQKEKIAGAYLITPFRKELGKDFLTFLELIKQGGIIL